MYDIFPDNAFYRKDISMSAVCSLPGVDLFEDVRSRVGLCLRSTAARCRRPWRHRTYVHFPSQVVIAESHTAPAGLKRQLPNALSVTERFSRKQRAKAETAENEPKRPSGAEIGRLPKALPRAMHPLSTPNEKAGTEPPRPPPPLRERPRVVCVCAVKYG